MKKRALWLINKEVLNNSDIPFLMDLGYEIYTVKRGTWRSRTEGIQYTDRYDGSLTLDGGLKSDMDKLTFMKPLSDEMWAKINREFGVVFLDLIKDQFEHVLLNFKGIIILRTAGASNADTISDQMAQDYGLRIFREIECAGARFWFSPVYKWTLKEEAPVLKRRYIELPMTIWPGPERDSDGAKKGIYIACPQIKINEEEEKLYQHVTELIGKKSEIGEAYTVLGNQFVSSDYDLNIAGHLSNEQLREAIRNGACLLAPQKSVGAADHYILMAFNENTPVLFDARTGLGKLWEKEKAPGAYCSDHEIREKIRRLEKGDTGLRRKIVRWQNEVMARAFSPDKNKDKFARSMEIIENKSGRKTHKVPSEPRVGIILFDRFSVATMLRLKTLLSVIEAGNGQKVSYCIGYPIVEEYGYSSCPNMLSELEKRNVSVRDYVLEQKSQQWIEDMTDMKGYPRISAQDGIFALNDGGTYFEDCDRLLFLLNSNSGSMLNIPNIVTTVPFDVYVPDYDAKKSAQDERAMERMSLNAHIQRAAGKVFVADPETKALATAELGIPEEQAVLAPALIPRLKKKNKENIVWKIADNHYFLFFTASSLEIPDSLVSKVLERYYLQDGKLSCAIIRQNEKCELYMRVVQQDHFLSKWKGNKDKRNPCEVTEICISLDQLANILEDATFAFLPEQFDLYTPVIGWSIDANVKTLCLKLPSVIGVERLTGAKMNYIKGTEAVSLADEIMDHDALQSPDAPDREALFAEADDKDIAQMINPIVTKY